MKVSNANPKILNVWSIYQQNWAVEGVNKCRSGYTSPIEQLGISISVAERNKKGLFFKAFLPKDCGLPESLDPNSQKRNAPILTSILNSNWPPSFAIPPNLRCLTVEVHIEKKPTTHQTTELARALTQFALGLLQAD